MISNKPQSGNTTSPRPKRGGVPNQLPPIRQITSVSWDVKGEDRDHSALKFGGLAVNYFAADRRNGPLLLLKGRREVAHRVAQELQRFLTTPTSQISTV